MNEHNPARISNELVGPNHRLLTTDDLDKPLPEGAEYWCYVDKCWQLKVQNNQAHPEFTYRIPLKPSDRLRQEIAKRLENEGWSEADIQDLKEWFDSKQPLPPAPSSIPWTLETHPDVASIMRRDDPHTHLLVTRWNEKGAVMDYGFLTYLELHSDWLQRNGQPTGQEVQS